MKNTYFLAFALTAAVAASMTGCGGTAVNESISVPEAVTSSSAAESTTVKSTTQAATSSAKETAASSSVEATQLSETESIFTKRDLSQTADTSDAKSLTVSDGKTIDITEEGVYVISGTAEDCTIRVEADEQAKVQLVLDGVSVTNTDFPVIYVVSADKVFVTTTDSVNSLTVSGEFVSDGETNTDAVIYSKDDLVLNGVGTLKITSDCGNGVSCKDDMKITGGTYDVSSALDAFEANDSISVNGGTFVIASDKDGFHCENDNAEGTITVYDGDFSINSGSDGIQACAMLQIDGGTMDISSSEGLEATYVLINGGTISIYASDDGINASAGTDAYEPDIEINGGSITVEVGPGDTDAFDANGSIRVNGGTINVTAQMSSFDYDRTAEFNGGTIIINGTEVSEIPQSMMGGGPGGGFGGGFGRGGHGRSDGQFVPDDMPAMF